MELCRPVHWERNVTWAHIFVSGRVTLRGFQQLSPVVTSAGSGIGVGEGGENVRHSVILAAA